MGHGETKAVEIHGLCRVYQRKKEVRHALSNVDLEVAEGQVHGLLGPNGAGKTTLCKILCTVLLPTSGSAKIHGHDVVADADAVRRAIGIVFGGERGLYLRLTARQNLLYWAALYRQPRKTAKKQVVALLDRLGLADRADDPVETMSRGMKQRLHLARGLIGDPRVLIFDEPTVGMDPVAARDFRRLVAELRDDGRSILVTTHDMAEAEALCDRVSLIDGGRMLATEEPKTLGQWISRYERVVAGQLPAEARRRIEALPGVASVAERPDGSAVIETAAEGASAEVLRALLDAGVTQVSAARPSLEEVYLRVIGDRGLSVR
ncbi:ABC transporter ATP-binding protein [Amycolatopsis nivea]|uniref:ABC transporter ATP-binding protein n=1 Tax=Amycolatopsis nivea TaxID=1644109 RepID=UPI00106F14A1|nr:ABC transporter ATP-binding protein [Amycolatopsis nivea]